MNHQLLIVSYQRDFPWLAQCLRSIDKFCTGFGVTIVVPAQQLSRLIEITHRLKFKNPHVFRIRTDREPAGLGQLFSQVTKCSADVFVPKETDFVHFIDSDCLVYAPTTPEQFFVDGKPIMRYRKYSDMTGDASSACIWKAVVEENLRFSVGNEYMCGMPMCYPIQLFSALRTHIETTHRQRFADYVFGTGKNSWPQRFCESNDLGALAWEKMHDVYHWVDVYHDQVRPETVQQFWSHGGFDFAGRGQTPRERIIEVLGSF